MAHNTLGSCFFSVAATLALGAVAAQGAPTASTTANAVYQSFSAADSENSTTVGQLIQAGVRAHPPTDPYEPSFSEAFARASVGGSLGARAIAGGWDPNYGPPYPCTADATARSTTPWSMQSDTLPFGTPFILRLQLRYDGVVGFGDYAGGPPGDPYAEVQGSLQVDGVEAFAASYRLSSDGTTNNNYFETFGGAWSSADVSVGTYAYPGTSTSIRARRLDATRTIDVPTTIGAQVELSLLLRSQCYTGGPVELFSVADFSNTAGYSLGSIDPASGLPMNVRIVAVPAPGICGVGLLSLMMCAGRRRR